MVNLQPVVEDDRDSIDPEPVELDDSHLWLLERRPWTQRTNRRLPLRFRDVLPQPLPPLQSAIISQPISSPVESSLALSGQPEGSESNHPSLPSQDLSRPSHVDTPRNIFGLSRRVRSEVIPSPDPEDHVSAQDLSTIPTHDHPDSTRLFYPYPNRNAFLLGDWYWNDGVQKSQASFDRLMGIVGSPDFKPTDIRDVNWHKINNVLGSEDEWEWMDGDAGWTRTPVTITVPYQRRRGVPCEPLAGPRGYVIGDFYHRSLVSVITEKLSRLKESDLFHFKPSELSWQRAPDHTPIRVQGELYTSPAFINAHQALQNSPPEPGCNLPRFVVALMFWSDVTHLTTFGDAKLWPLYMFFGNESKYHRCRPSCHLCEHVAYFQAVGILSPIVSSWFTNRISYSFQILSKILLQSRTLVGKPLIDHS